MKVLTAEQMREVDRATIEDGVPGIALMENAAHRVVEELVRQFSPLDKQNVVVLCGKGNNGGDGLAIARILRDYNVGRVRVVLAAGPSEYKGDAKANLDRMPEASIYPEREIPAKLRDRREVTIVIDALLGTGVKGAPEGRVAELIRGVSGTTRTFPEAKIVAVDLPSGLRMDMPADAAAERDDVVRADTTVTFTAPKIEHYLAPGCETFVGRLVVAGIGSPPWLIPGGLEVVEKEEFAPLFAPRKRDAHKGDFGHVLVVGGAPGKTGAAAMAGWSALKMGAGLVTVTAREVTGLAPELMTETLDEFTLERKTVIALGPGLGMNRGVVERVLRDSRVPVVIDADGLNLISQMIAEGVEFRGHGAATILTPHPGEMARLLGRPVGNRVEDARGFAKKHNVCLVLKGHRTLVADPKGSVWINTSGSPAMAKAGSGDILTGMIAGLVAQQKHPPRHSETTQMDSEDFVRRVRGAVWLHGRCGELAAAELTDWCVTATDLVRFLPAAIRELTSEPQ